MLFLLRGVPVVYYGDEQGFVGHGIDQAARQDMFASQVASYNDQALLGTSVDHRERELRCAASAVPPDRRAGGAAQAVRRAAPRPAGGARAVARSRVCSPLRASAATAAKSWWPSIPRTTPITAQVEIETGTRAFTALHGECAIPDAPGTVKLTCRRWDYVACVEATP